jgi:hypothetical protein
VPMLAGVGIVVGRVQPALRVTIIVAVRGKSIPAGPIHRGRIYPHHRMRAKFRLCRRPSAVPHLLTAYFSTCETLSPTE